MGWWYEYAWQSAKDVQKSLREELTSGGHNTIVKDASTSYGRHYWAAVRNEQTKKTVAFLALINSADGAWGYKSMDEGSGPYYYDCPLAILDACDPEPPNEWAANWRRKVRNYWAGRKTSQQLARTVKPGDLVAVEGANHSPYTVTRVEKAGRRLTIIGEGTNGQVYRLPVNRMTVVAQQLDVVQGLAEVGSFAHADGLSHND